MAWLKVSEETAQRLRIEDERAREHELAQARGIAEWGICCAVCGEPTEPRSLPGASRERRSTMIIHVDGVARRDDERRVWPYEWAPVHRDCSRGVPAEEDLVLRPKPHPEARLFDAAAIRMMRRVGLDLATVELFDHEAGDPVSNVEPEVRGARPVDQQPGIQLGGVEPAGLDGGLPLEEALNLLLDLGSKVGGVSGVEDVGMSIDVQVQHEGSSIRLSVKGDRSSLPDRGENAKEAA